MHQDKTAIERAFELTKSGNLKTIADVKKALSREGYVVSQIASPALMKQLRLAIASARRGTE